MTLETIEISITDIRRYNELREQGFVVMCERDSSLVMCRPAIND